MAADALAGLIAELPEGTVVTDPAITEGYRQDRALDPSAGKPVAVVRPRRTEEVQTVLRWATANHIPVVTRGMGTGLSGGATAVDGGIVLSTEKMRDIVVDPVPATTDLREIRSVTKHALINRQELPDERMALLPLAPLIDALRALLEKLAGPS